jgi:hypothetical protein
MYVDEILWPDGILLGCIHDAAYTYICDKKL